MTASTSAADQPLLFRPFDAPDLGSWRHDFTPLTFLTTFHLWPFRPVATVPTATALALAPGACLLLGDHLPHLGPPVVMVHRGTLRNLCTVYMHPLAPLLCVPRGNLVAGYGGALRPFEEMRAGAVPWRYQALVLSSRFFTTQLLPSSPLTTEFTL